MNIQHVIDELRYCAGLCHYYNDMPEMRDPSGRLSNEDIARSYLFTQSRYMARNGQNSASCALERASMASNLSFGGAWLTECLQHAPYNSTTFQP